MLSASRLLAALALPAALAACAARGPVAPDFTLTSDAGTAWSLSAQRGHPLLLTFGFTHCADTCPATLAKLAHVARSDPAARASGVRIAMITVDPKRDSPAVLHAFVSQFGSGIVGLTGSAASVRSVERAYHVWAQALPPKRGRPGYDVAHSAAIYVIDANGRIRGLYPDDEPAAGLVHAIAAVSG